MTFKDIYTLVLNGYLPPRPILLPCFFPSQVAGLFLYTHIHIAISSCFSSGKKYCRQMKQYVLFQEIGEVLQRLYK